MLSWINWIEKSQFNCLKMESTTNASSSSSSSTTGSLENIAGSVAATNEMEHKKLELEGKGDDEMSQPGPSTSSAGAEGGEEVDPLFLRQKTDLVFELRRLKLGDRPVTGQGNREAVEQFFNRRYNADESEPEPHDRPEEVLVEVQGLVDRRCVSSLLQTAQFRQRLEGALRSSLLTVRNDRIARGAAAARSQSPQSSSTDDSVHGAAAASPATSAASPNVPSPSIPLANNEPAPVERAASWLQRHVPEVPQAAPAAPAVHPEDISNRAPVSYEDWQQMHREDVLEEISELVQQQLVTQTLEGPFRDTLETRVLRERVASSGENGRRVQEFLRTLPRGQILRNDFSNLHLPPAIPLAGDALSDTVSVISATAAVQVSQSQSNTVMMREMNSLKAQIKELQNMMRLSFDLQLDVQRAIRQEVAAAIAQVAGEPTTASQGKPRPVNDSKCVICVEKLADTVMYQCGHLCTCYTCGMTLKTRGHHCPMCRAPIKDIIRAYKAELQ